MRTLTDNEISVALASLANWEHQVDTLARLAPTDDPKGFDEVIERVAGEDRDHISTVDTPNGVVLRVATPEARGITAVDVELAARIEQAIEMGGADAVPPSA
ncbi:pterin-4a-carbinolamine dehydratase [Spinactinospora alkalitolerans]|uniref:Putative pterin-4-alpha-carbinolamine dehydratase n=1 Tax=Spinactinospora alkalitolerans TaxID=687207 RepID=A0A852TTA6_9ACTN|nr:4a-hydroxytetrahydrobiopterin dehydratase [Spinactinospora alkalitolerans]NYE47676.1 pterin-4a-carbinolamine dehydratase [Spinactinospora alkalitolerans]